MKARLGFCVVIAALLGSAQVYADVVNLSSIRNDYGDAIVSGLVANDGIDADSNDSFNATVTYDTNNTSNSKALTADVWFVDRGPGNPNGLDLTGFDSLDFTVTVDPSSVMDAFGQYGFFEVFGRNTGGYNNVPLGSGTGLVVGDNVFSVPLTGMDDARALTFQLYGGPGQNLSGDVIFSVVDAELVSAVPEPSAIAFLALGIAGLVSRRRR